MLIMEVIGEHDTTRRRMEQQRDVQRLYILLECQQSLPKSIWYALQASAITLLWLLMCGLESGVNPVPDSTSCASLTAIPEQFRPIIFWFFTYIPAPMASVSLCTPSITLWDASVTVDIASNNLTSVVPIGPLGSHNGTAPALAQFAGNVTGDPLDGRAYNGLFFNLNDSADPFTLDRQTAIQLALPAAVFQAAEIFGLTEAFQQNMFANLSVDVYVSWSLPFFCFAGENRLIDQLAADNVSGPCSQDGVFFGYGTAPHHRDDDHP